VKIELGEKNMPRPIHPKRKKVIVHLGNVDDARKTSIGGKTEYREAAKTAEYANRFPDFQFIGIDKLKLNPKEANWLQIEADFMEGLERLENNKVDVISSEMAVGYFGPRFTGARNAKNKGYKTHTAAVLVSAYKKLRPKGRMHLVVRGELVHLIKKSLLQAGFEEEKITMKKMPKNSSHQTRWIKRRLGEKGNPGFFQFTAEK